MIGASVDYSLILKAAGALSFVGLIASGMLVLASKRFSVEADPRIEKVLSVLPGANCGACGNPSCFLAAEKLVDSKAPITLCTAGGQEVADALAGALGVAKCEVAVLVSSRACGGGVNAELRYIYSGLASCHSVVRVAGGDLQCDYGCLGRGDCVRACPFGAIELDHRSLPVIDSQKCTGCEICIGECPRSQHGLLRMMEVDSPVVVRCCATDPVRCRKDHCSKCCIGCGKCVKSCPRNAIQIRQGLAVIDYGLCNGCSNCVEVCPKQCIDHANRDSAVDWLRLDGVGSTESSEMEAAPLGSAIR